MELIYGAAGGGIVGLICCVFALFTVGYFKRALAERDRLFELRISSIEERLKNHTSSDRSQEILAKLAVMDERAREWRKEFNGRLEVLTTKVDRALESNAAQQQSIENNTHYINNLRDDMNTHVRTFHTGD